jgi:cell division protease FtsH
MATDRERKGFHPGLGYILLALWAVLLLQQIVVAYVQPDRMAYSDFRGAVAADRVAEVSIGPTLIRGRLKPEAAAEAARSARGEPQGGGKAPAGTPFETIKVEDPALLGDLQTHKVKVSGFVESRFWSTALSWLVPVGLFVLLWTFMLRRLGAGNQNGFMAIGRSKAKVFMEKEVKVRFSDVAGVDEAKDDLCEVIEFLRTPLRFGRLGAKLPKGVLLVGPPGTGKTLLARAVAGEAGVPFFFISGSDFVEMFVGVGAARVRDLFEQAKQRAPCIIFIDELDALGKARGVGPVTHEEREQTLNQLLVELDGFDPRLGVILMAATNRPEILDPALLRAGRFDRHVLVDRPDKAGRLAILRVHARNVPMDSDADLDSIAAMTAGFAGADLANIINEAALLGVRRDQERVTLAELQEAVERVMAGQEKKNRVLSPTEKRRVAYHELGHALIAEAIPGMDDVHKISIIPRGVAALGYTLQVPTEDRFLMTESELKDKISVLLGGRAAEELIYDEVSTGAHDDLAKATDIARSMVKTYGMSARLGQVSLEKDRRSVLLGPAEVPHLSRVEYSERTAQEVDAEIRRIIDEQRERVAGLLAARRELLMEAARLLLAKETISGDELRRLIARGEAGPIAADDGDDRDHHHRPEPGGEAEAHDLLGDAEHGASAGR